MGVFRGGVVVCMGYFCIGCYGEDFVLGKKELFIYVVGRSYLFNILFLVLVKKFVC